MYFVLFYIIHYLLFIFIFKVEKKKKKRNNTVLIYINGKKIEGKNYNKIFLIKYVKLIY